MIKVPDISKRAQTAPSSPVRKLVPLAEKTKQKGIKIYHINIGDPDFEAPAQIQKDLKEFAKTQKRIPYTSSKGLKETIVAWKKYYKDIGIDINEEDIVISAGGGEGLIITFATVLDPSDEFIVFEPFYANYASFGNIVSGKMVSVPLDRENGYHMPKDEDIISRITKKTKAICLINPNNPTGTVFTPKEVERVIKLAVKHNLFLISDETYMGMVFDGKECKSVLHLANDKEKQNIIIVDSVSKKLNMCGARVGAIISKNKEVMDAVFRFAQGRLSVPYIEQVIVCNALSDCLPYISWLTKEYQKRRNSFIATLEKKLNLKIPTPEGAFYAMVKLPVDDTEKFAKWLLTDFSDKEETVMVAPGGGFYENPVKGKQEIRVAYVLNEKDLSRAAELLAFAVKEYNKK